MTAPAWHSTAETEYGAFDAEAHYAHGELLPGERIGSPASGSGGKALLRGGFILLIALSGGWLLLGDQVTWPEWPLAGTAAVSPAMDRRLPASVEPPAPPMATTAPPANAEPITKPAALDSPPSTPQPPASSKTAATAGDAARSAARPLTTASLPPAAKSVGEPPAPPLQPPTANSADAYQMRAAAVGLHPDLSRVLLTQLSPADYRNAGIAIKTAMAETPDSAVFVWPRQRKAELAFFQVRFVPGAAPGCRRYVVAVTKDGWLTTALPMEKCGSQPGRPRRE